MLAIELNTAIKSHFATLGAPYSDVSFFPMTAYEDTTGPFITYYEYPGTQSEEQYFLRVSNLVYFVYDNDIDRADKIVHALESFLNKGDDISGIVALRSIPAGYGEDLRYRLTSIRLVSGTMSPPIEKDGFAAISRNFRTTYVNV